VNGPGHYRLAEELLELADQTATAVARINDGDGESRYATEALMGILAGAQVHATLALAAATATAMLDDRALSGLQLSDFGHAVTSAWAEAIA
jgi:hypothetical protein